MLVFLVKKNERLLFTFTRGHREHSLSKDTKGSASSRGQEGPCLLLLLHSASCLLASLFLRQRMLFSESWRM